VGPPSHIDRKVVMRRMIVLVSSSRVMQSKMNGTAWLLNMGPTGCPKTSVTTDQICVTSQKSEDLRTLRCLPLTIEQLCSFVKSVSIYHPTPITSHKDLKLQ